MKKFVLVSIILGFLIGCYGETVEVKKSSNSFSNASVATSRIGVMIPKDGICRSYDPKQSQGGSSKTRPYTNDILTVMYGSGMKVSKKIQEILSTRMEENSIILINGTTDRGVAILKAREQALKFVVLIDIYKWQEEKTASSIIPDDLGITFQLYDLTNDKITNEINYYAKYAFWDRRMGTRTEELMDREEFYQAIFNLIGL